MDRRLVRGHLPRLIRMALLLEEGATALPGRLPEATANRKAASARRLSNTADHRLLAAATDHHRRSPRLALRPAAVTVNRKAATAVPLRRTALRAVSVLRKIRTAAGRWSPWAAVNAAPSARSATRS